MPGGIIDGNDINLTAGLSPVASDPIEGEVPCSGCGKVPHPLPADILIDIGDMALYEPFLYEPADIGGLASLDICPVRIDEPEPEGNEVVLYPVESALALLRIRFGDRDFPLDHIHIHQGLQIACQPILWNAHRRCDIGKLPVPHGD